MVIGVLGGSGSGKSTFCRAAEPFGYTVIDADKLGHEIIKKGRPAYDKLLDAFGSDILADDGEIERKKLGRLAFANEQSLAVLNNIVQTKITEEIMSILSSPDVNAVIDAAVLHTTALLDRCDKVVFVKADRAVRIERIMARDKLTREAAEARLNGQPSDEVFAGYADVVFENNGSLSDTRRLARQFFAEVSV